MGRTIRIYLADGGPSRVIQMGLQADRAVISNVKIIEGADLNPVITVNFILIPNSGTVDSSREYRVRFTATRVPARSELAE